MAVAETRATLIRNPEYERNGLRSYSHAVQKCQFLNATSASTAISDIWTQTTSPLPAQVRFP